MNSVHLVTQEKKTSQNGSTMGRVHRVHCPRPAQAPRPRPGRAWPRAQRLCLASSARPAAPLPRAPRARAPAARAPCLPRAPAARHACRSPLPSAPRTPAQRPTHAQPSAPAPSPAPQPHAQWAVAIQVLYPKKKFFFYFFFFHFFQPLENNKKYIYLFYFIFQYTNKFIKIYFISNFFFPTNQINCLNLFYLFSCSSLHIVNSKVCFPTCLCAIYLSTQTFTSHIQHVIHTKQIHTTIHQST